jgi:VIT family
VLGANDGIVSVAGIVVGVAGATAARGPIFTAGLAGLVAGAVAMSLGEYLSVSSQRDSQRAQLVQEKRELAETPDQELAELTALYRAKGLSAATARTVATCPKDPWRCSTPTAIMSSSPLSKAARRHRGTQPRSPPPCGTLPWGRGRRDAVARAWT